MNAHLHIYSSSVFGADVAALHSAAETMQHDATRHREYDARAKKAAAHTRSNASTPAASTDSDGAKPTTRPTEAAVPPLTQP